MKKRPEGKNLLFSIKSIPLYTKNEKLCHSEQRKGIARVQQQHLLVQHNYYLQERTAVSSLLHNITVNTFRQLYTTVYCGSKYIIPLKTALSYEKPYPKQISISADMFYLTPFLPSKYSALLMKAIVFLAFSSPFHQIFGGTNISR